MSSVLSLLYDQRMKCGTDLLEQNRKSELQKIEEAFLSNKAIVGEQYQIWAAKAIDKGEWTQAVQLIAGSYRQLPINVKLLRTCLYLIRKRCFQYFTSLFRN